MNLSIAVLNDLKKDLEKVKPYAGLVVAIVSERCGLAALTHSGKADIKFCRRQMVRLLHPDKAGEDAQLATAMSGVFGLVNAALDSLEKPPELLRVQPQPQKQQKSTHRYFKDTASYDEIFSEIFGATPTSAQRPDDCKGSAHGEIEKAFHYFNSFDAIDAKKEIMVFLDNKKIVPLQAINAISTFRLGGGRHRDLSTRLYKAEPRAYVEKMLPHHLSNFNRHECLLGKEQIIRFMNDGHVNRQWLGQQIVIMHLRNPRHIDLKAAIELTAKSPAPTGPR